MDMPLIFLDYDGVVTSTLETPGSFINHSPEEYGTSPKCLQRLIELCKKTNAKIVITSNWRKFPPEGFWHKRDNVQIPNNLPKFKEKISRFLYGELPPVRHVNKSKALELWEEQHPEFSYKTDKYVIFDDDVREEFQSSKFRNHFILTDAEIGLSDEDCKSAEWLLT